jgi:hypothetical protein
MNTPNTTSDPATVALDPFARARAAFDCSHAIAALRSVDAALASTYARRLRSVVAVGTVEALRALRNEIDATYRATVAR